MPIVVMPQTVVPLTQFLESHGLTLLVRQTGVSQWEASFVPEVLEETDDDVYNPIMLRGDSREEAVQNMCAFLSGQERLSVDADIGPVDLDLYYTRVEYDWDGGTAEAGNDSGAPSLLKGVLRHHGSE